MLCHSLLLCMLIFLSSSSHNLFISPSSPLSLQLPAAIPLHSSAFGYTPKGVSINGILALSNPLDACNKLPSQIETVGNIHAFYLANSLNCAVSLKAKNIFDANGYAAIIIKDSNTVIEKHGSKVNMPVLEISPQVAKIIIEYMEQNPKQQILTTIIFSNPSHKPTQNEIDITLWMSSTNIEAYDFIETFKQFYLQQTQRVYLKPRYVLDSKVSNKTAYHVGCLSSGKYCAPELELHSRIEGKQVVQEDLRQIIIHETQANLWFNYVNNWKTDCLSNPHIFSEIEAAESCSNFSMVKAGINPDEIKKLFTLSFRGPKIQIEDNEILMAQLNEQQSQKINTWPRLYINHKPFNNGKKTLSQAVQDITLNVCMIQSPNLSPNCRSLYDSHYEDNDDELFIMTMVIAALLLLMAILLLVYKCVMRRKMKEQVQEEVDRVLEQYYTYEGATRLQSM